MTYEQEHHRDYLNHTPLAPSSDIRWRGLEMFIWSCDVTEELGPTHFVPLSLTEGLPALPHVQRRSERPALYEQEVSGAGPVGTLVAYSTDTFHRATELSAPGADRFSIHASYRQFHPDWQPFVDRRPCASYSFLGFLLLVTQYWTIETLEGVATRYPGLDVTPWKGACNPRTDDPYRAIGDTASSDSG
jgi:hypothetical protein